MSPRNDSDNNLGRCGERTPPASTALSDYLVLDLTLKYYLYDICIKS